MSVAFHSLPEGFLLKERFRISSFIGQGKSSAVYKALDLTNQTVVCVKVLDPFLIQDPTAMERFEREAQAIHSLNHPNIIKVFGLHHDRFFKFMVLEFFQGVNLDSYIKAKGPFDVGIFLILSEKILGALHACHRNQIVHRDIKPSNLLVNVEGTDIRLVDFGISKINSMSDLTKTGTVIGTPEYMAPELFQVNCSDARSDIFSIGVVFYEMLSGVTPYSGTSLLSIMKQMMSGEYARLRTLNPNVTDWLEAVVDRCLMTDPSLRYQSIMEISTDLAKEQNSMALAEKNRTKIECLSCHTKAIPGLPFCFNCGRYFHEAFRSGEFSLILTRARDHGDELAIFLKSINDRLPLADIKRQLQNMPLLLIRNLSHSSVIALSHNLSLYSCDFTVTKSLPKDFALSKALLGVLLFPILFVLLKPSFLSGIMGVLMAFGILFSVYLMKTKPLLSSPKKRVASSQAPYSVEFANQVRSALSESSDIHLKSIIGHIAAYAFLKQQNLDKTAVDGVVSSSLEAFKELTILQEQCKPLSLNRLKDRVFALEQKIRVAKETREIEELLEQKIGAEKHFQNAKSLISRHSDLYSSLYSANALLAELLSSDAGISNGKESSNEPSHQNKKVS